MERPSVGRGYWRPGRVETENDMLYHNSFILLLIAVDATATITPTMIKGINGLTNDRTVDPAKLATLETADETPCPTAFAAPVKFLTNTCPTLLFFIASRPAAVDASRSSWACIDDESLPGINQSNHAILLSPSRENKRKDNRYPNQRIIRERLKLLFDVFVAELTACFRLPKIADKFIYLRLKGRCKLFY